MTTTEKQIYAMKLLLRCYVYLSDSTCELAEELRYFIRFGEPLPSKETRKNGTI